MADIRSIADDQRPVASPAGGAADAELLARSRGGDVRAFGALAALYQDRLYNACWRMCGSRTDAEDFAQEALLRAFRSIDRFDGRSQFYTWLFRIAVNLIISARRRPAIARGVSFDGAAKLDDGRRASPDGRSAESPSPDYDVEVREEHARVLAALQELDADQRAAVVMRDIEGMDYPQIAAALGVPAGTVKSRLHRARLALRERLRSANRQ